MSEETAREETALRIEPIDEKSPHLPAVIALGRANKRTLGLFPDEAFVDRAAAREILVAIAAEEEVSGEVSEEKCVGYLLYRSVPSEKHIVIVHLCIDLSWRGRGLAKKLVDFLSEITQDYFYGIKLKCRRDYGLQKMWERLGFFPANEKPGRSRDGKELTVWWRDHGHSDLFSLLAEQKLESKLGAVIDASVFFDLESSESDNSESASLLADWLEPNLNLCVTDDIFYAVDKIEDSKQRKSQRLLAETFDRLRCSQWEFEAKLQDIADFFVSTTDSPVAKANIGETARRQLARAIAVETSVLVTRDRNLLAIAEAIAAKFHLSILSPTELIVKLDEVSRKAKYPPQRLAGTNLRIQNIQSIESLQPSFIENFRSRSCGETIKQFRQRLHSFQDKDKCDRSLVLNAENQPLALIVCDRRHSQELQIPMMRVKGGKLAATLARHLIFRSVSQAADENRPFVRISDPYLDSTCIEAIQEDAFIRVSEQYLKVNLPVAATAEELAERLLVLARLDSDYNFCQQYAETLTSDRRETDSIVAAEVAAELENRLWPAKITDAPLLTAIVPIKARWAKDLFDKELANQYLFASTNNLPLKRELVYYRSKRANAGLKPGAIGRILWYVSNDKNYLGSKALRACSRLDEVIVDKPETLHRQFSNFGVYKLQDLLDLAKNQPKQDIMALRFSDTKVFVRPIEWDRLKQILGLQAPIQSPIAISPAQFDIIYNLGIQSERKLY
ncbi:MAG: GNAT family N-acetyltransferase [Oscillatoria sp. SIO1A7]|nr:GNAT family N-acetyltransferase [Oscillatoria sp. SIO1A7]